jgi:hypothetical protein
LFAGFLLRGVLFLPSCRLRDELFFEFIIKIFAKVLKLQINSIYQLLFLI